MDKKIKKIEISHYWVFITEYEVDNPNLVETVVRYKRLENMVEKELIEVNEEFEDNFSQGEADLREREEYFMGGN